MRNSLDEMFVGHSFMKEKLLSPVIILECEHLHLLQWLKCTIWIFRLIFCKILVSSPWDKMLILASFLAKNAKNSSFVPQGSWNIKSFIISCTNCTFNFKNIVPYQATKLINLLVNKTQQPRHFLHGESIQRIKKNPLSVFSMFSKKVFSVLHIVDLPTRSNTWNLS